MRRELIRGAIVVALALTACGGDPDYGDQSAEMACDSFRVLAGDVQDDQLTTEEVRSAMQEVEGQASRSENAELAEAARDMVAGVTAGDDDRLAAAVQRVDDACTDAGY